MHPLLSLVFLPNLHTKTPRFPLYMSLTLSFSSFQSQKENKESKCEEMEDVEAVGEGVFIFFSGPEKREENGPRNQE